MSDTSWVIPPLDCRDHPSIDGGSTWILLQETSPAPSSSLSDWNYRSLPLFDVAGKTVWIRFKATGTSEESRWILDDIRITPPSDSPKLQWNTVSGAFSYELKQENNGSFQTVGGKRMTS